MDSILTYIKNQLGISEEDTHFDNAIMGHINSGFSILTQIGIGPNEGFAINSRDAVWTDFITDTITIGFVKSYIHLQVWLLFDPPSNSAVIESITGRINELSWRLGALADLGQSHIT